LRKPHPPLSRVSIGYISTSRVIVTRLLRAFLLRRKGVNILEKKEMFLVTPGMCERPHPPLS